jgi:hypothetical protein
VEESNETEIAIPDTYQNLPHAPYQLKDILMSLTNELASTREMNVQLTNDMSQLKTTVSRRWHDHHVLKSVPQEKG